VKGNSIEGVFDTGSQKTPWSATIGG
jgi:hypothetical protein